MRKVNVKVRQNIIEDAHDSLTYWYIRRTHAKHVEPERWGYRWDEFSDDQGGTWWLNWTRVMHRVEYTLLDVESSPDHVLFPHCVLMQEVFSAELWIPDERELAEDPLFQAPV